MQLTRRHTMKRASEFAMVRTEGSSEAGRFLVLNLARKPDAGAATQPSSFGIITTKRLGHAVVRNLLRRRVREILREHGEPISRGFNVVLVLRHRAVFADYARLEAEFLKLLRRHLHRQESC